MRWESTGGGRGKSVFSGTEIWWYSWALSTPPKVNMMVVRIRITETALALPFRLQSKSWSPGPAWVTNGLYSQHFWFKRWVEKSRLTGVVPWHCCSCWGCTHHSWHILREEACWCLQENMQNFVVGYLGLLHIQQELLWVSRFCCYHLSIRRETWFAAL